MALPQHTVYKVDHRNLVTVCHSCHYSWFPMCAPFTSPLSTLTPWSWWQEVFQKLL